jgi:transposase
MARRTFDVVDVTEIFIHWYAGRSLNEVSASLGVDRKTIRKYLAPAVAAGLAPGGPAMMPADWARLVAGWFPGLADSRLRQVTWPEIARHHEYITAQLKLGVTQVTIHQRLRDEHGLAASVASLKRYVAANLPEEVRRDRVVVLRDEADTPAGEEAQIDYGLLGTWVDPVTGKRRRVWAFAMVLACSRHMFVRPVLTMDQAAWTEAHVEAFAFFGGVPRRLIPDNLKTGVDKPDLYDPKLNRSYAELAAHYGTLVDPARRGKPRDKARIEKPMPYIRDSFWRAASSPPSPRCGPPRWPGAPKWLGGGCAGRFPGRRRRRCSPRSKRRRCNRCRPSRSSSRRGPRPRSGRTSTSGSARRSTRCRGGSSGRRSMPGRP